MTAIRNILFMHQDPKYAEFIAKLIPNLPKEKFIGIRSPEYKKIIKELPDAEEVNAFMEALPHEYYEENILHGALISRMKDFDSCLPAVERFLPYVDNWAVCDGLQPTVFRKNTAVIKRKIPEWIASEAAYTRRFGMHMLMTHFLEDEFDESLLSQPADLRSEEYYVNMMTAWLFAEALARQWEAAIPFLEEKRLDRWTHNKAIQKAIESYRITDVQKEYLRSLRITRENLRFPRQMMSVNMQGCKKKGRKKKP